MINIKRFKDDYLSILACLTVITQFSGLKIIFDPNTNNKTIYFYSLFFFGALSFLFFKNKTKQKKLFLDNNKQTNYLLSTVLIILAFLSLIPGTCRYISANTPYYCFSCCFNKFDNPIMPGLREIFIKDVFANTKLPKIKKIIKSTPVSKEKAKITKMAKTTSVSEKSSKTPNLNVNIDMSIDPLRTSVQCSSLRNKDSKSNAEEFTSVKDCLLYHVPGERAVNIIDGHLIETQEERVDFEKKYFKTMMKPVFSALKTLSEDIRHKHEPLLESNVAGPNYDIVFYFIKDSEWKEKVRKANLLPNKVEEWKKLDSISPENANELKRVTWCQNMKYTIIIVAVVVGLLLVIILPIVIH